MIDKSSNIPVYIQIAEEIKTNIKEHVYNPGEAIPTERELTEEFGVSRMTIRQAVSNLIYEGVLYKTRGKGAFVSKETIEKKMEIESFSDDMRKRGLTPSSKVLFFEKITPDEEVRQKLQLEETDKVFFLNRIRMANEEPMAIEYCYLPEKYYPNLTKYNVVQCSLYALIKEEYNVEFNFMRQVIKAVNLGKKEAEMLLGKPKGFALLSHRIIYNADEEPIEYTKTVYDPERYSFNVTIFDNK
jgi:GntR family transcriptional regulator